MKGTKGKREKGKGKEASHWWLISVTLATWKTEIGRVIIQGQPRQKVSKTPS
jgi:hypothetical protein